jgi:hypothetical protein
MTEREALKRALEALNKLTDVFLDTEGNHGDCEQKAINQGNKAITAIKDIMAQPKQKYRRGNRLICLETEEYCVIHISGTDRQWVKFPDSHIGVYTNEQVAELFELLPKEPEQEPVAWTLLLVGEHHGIIGKAGDAFASAPEHYRRVDVYTTPPQRTWVWLTDDEIEKMGLSNYIKVVRETEAKLKEKNT